MADRFIEFPEIGFAVGTKMFKGSKRPCGWYRRGTAIAQKTLSWPGKMSNLNPTQTIVLYQPTLYAIAMKFLRCKADAEDIVQETFVRWLNTEHAKIENTKAYLVRAVTNNCIKHLHAIKRKKEQYLAGINVGEWVDKFKETDLSAEFEARLGKAFHIIQHKLEPLERAVYVLKEAFGFDYKALQVVLDRKQDHCRQLFSRAKKKIATERARLSTVIEEQTALLKSFLQACDTGKAEPIIDELTRDLPAAVKK